ncbi:FAD-binding oxidoreductase, partial [Mesorhizobium sp. M4B.F.Ca.ET.203.01.1.1]|uniref:FAD-binding oxidoreductase n=1 Tax=Mesorhizobium sp. M4B.F.Ca.ET.203.01.1.1 TaxID=2563953 RepID=UPI001AED335F
MGSSVNTTLRYCSGFSALTAAMTPAPWARKSARRAAAKSSTSVFRKRLGLAGGASTSAGQVICDLSGLNRIEEIDPDRKSV